MGASVTPCLRICLWSGPRNVSTALMYAFNQRQDTQVVDEPFYGHYLRVSGANHPGAQEIMTTVDCDAEQVIQNVILGPCERPILFLKNMTHHLVDINWHFLRQMTNVLLIRNPQDMVPSLAQTLARPTLKDTGLKKQVTLFKTLIKWGYPPPVLDAHELLLDPASVLNQLCHRIGILFDETMLYWPAGPKRIDGVWAKYWYHNVHQSTRFEPYRPKIDPFPETLQPLLTECQPYYDHLRKYAIQARSPHQSEDRRSKNLN